jgi:hypothetical protein
MSTKVDLTVRITFCSVATLTTVPGFGASNSFHLGAAREIWTMEAPLESRGPSALSSLQASLQVVVASAEEKREGVVMRNHEARKSLKDGIIFDVK